MKMLSLKLKEEIFQEVENIIDRIHMPRNTYINKALDFYNKLNKRRMLKNQLIKASQLVREDSMEVLREFEEMGDELPE